MGLHVRLSLKLFDVDENGTHLAFDGMQWNADSIG
jgi:hypothetical protein